MRKLPVRRATNENVAFLPGESPTVGCGVDAPENAAVTASEPLTIAHEWRMLPRFSQSTTTRQPTGIRT